MATSDLDVAAATTIQTYAVAETSITAVDTLYEASTQTIDVVATTIIPTTSTTAIHEATTETLYKESTAVVPTTVTNTVPTTIDVETVVPVTVTSTTSVTPTPTTFLLKGQTGTKAGYYMYVNPSTSTTGRYVFFITSATTASRFTMDSVAGYLKDTATGYDIYLSNANNVIATAQAYDAVTAAATSNVAGFNCAPRASGGLLLCNNVNSLNALRGCGAYLYATSSTYSILQCTGGKSTFAAVY